jgi:hypothetical protein
MMDCPPRPSKPTPCKPVCKVKGVIRSGQDQDYTGNTIFYMTISRDDVTRFMDHTTHLTTTLFDMGSVLNLGTSLVFPLYSGLALDDAQALFSDDSAHDAVYGDTPRENMLGSWYSDIFNAATNWAVDAAKDLIDQAAALIPRLNSGSDTDRDGVTDILEVTLAIQNRVAAALVAAIAHRKQDAGLIRSAY